MMMMMVVVVAHDAHQPVGLALSGTDGCCTSRCRPVRSALLCRDISSSPCPPKVQVISVPGRHPACSLTTCFPPPIRAPPKPATARHADSGRNRTASTSQAPLVCRASQTRALTTIDITQGPGDGPAVCSVGARMCIAGPAWARQRCSAVSTPVALCTDKLYPRCLARHLPG